MGAISTLTNKEIAHYLPSMNFRFGVAYLNPILSILGECHVSVDSWLDSSYVGVSTCVRTFCLSTSLLRQQPTSADVVMTKLDKLLRGISPQPRRTKISISVGRWSE
jgi:hypothetical protein